MTRPSLMTAGAAMLICALPLAACRERAKPAEAHAGADGYERGPHRGRILRDGDFALELTIFEEGQEPQFRAYAYRKDKPVDPRQVSVTVELARLGGKVDRFAFRPEADYLAGGDVVSEPHSFDVKVTASEGGRRHGWSYASYEGRTSIKTAAAQAGGVRTETAGAATLSELVDIGGRVEVTPEGKADVRAWYPGRILSLSGELGQAIRKGQPMARVESSYSLQAYTIPAPINGLIVEKRANVGGVAGEAPLFVIADPNQLHAEFFVYPRDAERVLVGQSVEVRSLNGQQRLAAKVEAVVPTADLVSQTLVAHVHLPATGSNAFRPGMGVEGAFVVGAKPVALAVRSKALQRFRDFDVVYARVGETYEVRMLELGRRTPEWTEVRGGLEPGTEYVVDGAFLIRADIDKAGASHDH